MNRFHPPTLLVVQPKSTIWQSRIGEGFLPTAQDFGVEAGIAPGIATFGSTQAHDMALLSLVYGHMLGRVKGEGHWYRGNIEGRLELFGGGQYSPSTESVIGLTPHLRYDFATGNDAKAIIQRDDGVTPTPVISRSIIVYNRGRKERLADGIIIMPSHNPPEDGGLKYNLPNGGPADTDVTHWVQTDEAAWELIGLAWSSKAGLAIAPLQDLLNLGSQGRMNLPGSAEGNWHWRCTEEMLAASVFDRLGGLTEASSRVVRFEEHNQPENVESAS